MSQEKENGKVEKYMTYMSHNTYKEITETLILATICLKCVSSTTWDKNAQGIKLFKLWQISHSISMSTFLAQVINNMDYFMEKVHWTLSTVWGIFKIHNILSVGSTLSGCQADGFFNTGGNTLTCYPCSRTWKFSTSNTKMYVILT
jgi:hypothetical protein